MRKCVWPGIDLSPMLLSSRLFQFAGIRGKKWKIAQPVKLEYSAMAKDLELAVNCSEIKLLLILSINFYIIFILGIFDNDFMSKGWWTINDGQQITEQQFEISINHCIASQIVVS